MQKIIIATALVAGSAYALSTGLRSAAPSREAAGRPTAAVMPAHSQLSRIDSGTEAIGDSIKPRRACTLITSLPRTISAPGRYCYGSDLASSSLNGLRIEASDVALDCAGFRTTSSLARTAGSDGIYTAGPVRNVTIRNCHVIGFDRGITAFAGAAAVRILDNQVDAAQTMGIGAWGDGAQVIGNRVTNTHPSQPGQYSNGITLLPVAPETAAQRQVVKRNVVVNVYGSPQTTGIVVSGSTAPSITGNSVMELRPDAGGQAIGLWLSDWAQGARTTAADVVDNQLMTRPSSVYSDFATQTAQSVASCARNVTVGVSASNLTVCPSGGENIVVP